MLVSGGGRILDMFSKGSYNWRIFFFKTLVINIQLLYLTECFVNLISREGHSFFAVVSLFGQNYCLCGTQGNDYLNTHSFESIICSRESSCNSSFGVLTSNVHCNRLKTQMYLKSSIHYSNVFCLF